MLLDAEYSGLAIVLVVLRSSLELDGISVVARSVGKTRLLIRHASIDHVLEQVFLWYSIGPGTYEYWC